MPGQMQPNHLFRIPLMESAMIREETLFPHRDGADAHPEAVALNQIPVQPTRAIVAV
jgi:hypothetical protein